MSAVFSDALPVMRPMRFEDLEEVMLAECAAYDHPWTRGIFEDCLRVGYYCVVCEIDGRVIGHGVMSLGVGECHLLNISIHPEFQRRHLGRQLVSYLLDMARWKKARVAFLEVRVSNTPAFKLYSALGFNEIGVRHQYYPAINGEREDALILALDLGKPRAQRKD